MSELLKFIHNHPNDYKQLLKKDLKINIKEYDQYTLYIYQDHADFSNPIVQECRGIILNKDNKIVCAPFYKFGNFYEKYVPDIDWFSARVEEKLDGSIVKVWYDCDSWHYSSNSVINYSCPVKIDDSILEKFDQNLTYIFELIGKNNGQKVPYLTDELVHIGTRNNNTLKEFAFKLPYFRTPRVFDLHSLKECEEYLDNINEFIEGLVIVDKNFNRLKIKTERYLKTVIPSKEKIIQTLLMNEKFDSDFPENYFDNEKRSIEMYKKELHAGNIKSFTFRKNKMLNEDEWIKQNLNNVVKQIIKNKY